MPSYQISFTPLAEKDLNKLEAKVGFRILEKIKMLSQNPHPQGVKKVKGSLYYRIRVSDYRVLYEIDESNNHISIYKIRHRKDVYK